MTVSEKIQAVLEAAAAVTVLVPAARIRRPGLTEDVARPYIMHFPVTARPSHVYGNEGLRATRIWDVYQVSIFGDSLSSCEAISAAVRDALDGNHSGVDVRWSGGGYLGREDLTGVEHFVMEFRIIENL